LAEAAEHLEKALAAARAGNVAAFEAWVPFAYRKLNAAWNSRALSHQDAMNLDTYEDRCRFPIDLDDFFNA
jgi:hypothetical protein